MTAGPGASAFVLVPAYEKVVRTQKSNDEAKQQQLEDEYKTKSTASQTLIESGSSWLTNMKVKSLQDLNSEGNSLYSVDSSITEESSRLPGK